MSEPNETTHVRVRVCVKVDANGDYEAYGSRWHEANLPDAAMAKRVSELIPIGAHHFIEAWIPKYAGPNIIESKPHPTPNEAESP